MCASTLVEKTRKGGEYLNWGGFYKVGRSGSSCVCRFFFFQAEDGIRDVAVTGVQTCALPISRGQPGALLAGQLRQHDVPDPAVLRSAFIRARGEAAVGDGELRGAVEERNVTKIGRASCRERV